ncbi:hypothetical protein LV89_03834 [Arcicella aurantiaca]|uniref:Uncharacterized protein n=1 Tax=Arcicella aurantiaca TaxID=591202 RepID=A0A316DQD6_9BACT|nr:hypothetical protein [Arcicella aurantiaca]PWK20291.1 hypothetical protein LV89_03834 [Arcicella aurantiaca]
MSWKELRNEIDEKSVVPKINPVKVIQAKKVDGIMKFREYELETKLETLTDIGTVRTGVYIGHYYKLEVYSKIDEASINSTPYFNKTDSVKLYCTKRDTRLSQSVKDFKGSAENAREHIKALTGDCKTFAIVVIATKDGVFEIKTNPSIFLCDEKKFIKHCEDYEISYKPVCYNPDIYLELPQKWREMDAQYYPSFIAVELTQRPITDALANILKLREVCQNFIDFKKYVKSGQVYNQVEQPATPKPESPSFAPVPTFPTNNAGDDDLPF